MGKLKGYECDICKNRIEQYASIFHFPRRFFRKEYDDFYEKYKKTGLIMCEKCFRRLKRFVRAEMADEESRKAVD